DFSGTIYWSSTTVVTASSITLSGLTTNSLYYLRLGTLNVHNVPNFVAAASAQTLNSPVAPVAQPLTNVWSSSATTSWLSGGNNAATTYAVAASTTVNFAQGSVTTMTTTALTATFTSLTSNATYWFHVAVQATGAPTPTVLGSTVTLAASPTVGAVSTFTAANQTSMTVTWGNGGNVAGTPYVVILSSSPTFSFGVISSTTFNLSMTTNTFLADTIYYLSVTATNRAGASSGAFTGSTATLAPAV